MLIPRSNSRQSMSSVRLTDQSTDDKLKNKQTLQCFGSESFTFQFISKWLMKELLPYCSARLFPQMDCQSNWPSHQVWKEPSFSWWSNDQSIDQWSTHLIVTPSINSLINKLSKGIFFARPILCSFTDGYMFVDLVTSGRPPDRPSGQSSAGRPHDRRDDRSAAWPTNLLADRHTLALGRGRRFVLKTDRSTNRRHRSSASS
jgi:hypothetical protein